MSGNGRRARCADTTKEGLPCPANARRRPDPDGKHRCPHHTVEPSVREAIRISRYRGAFNGSEPRLWTGEGGRSPGAGQRVAQHPGSGARGVPSESVRTHLYEAVIGSPEPPDRCLVCAKAMRPRKGKAVCSPACRRERSRQRQRDALRDGLLLLRAQVDDLLQRLHAVNGPNRGGG